MAISSPFFCDSCGAANRPQAVFCYACGQPLQAQGGKGSGQTTGLLVFNHLLKQRYRIISQVGKGGFGAVYKAADLQFGNRQVAIKEMSQSSLSQQELIEATEAFKREALLLAGLTHPNLPRIYEQFTDTGRWYLVMDFIEGETLEDHLDKIKGGKFPVEQVLEIGIQLCTVLEYLHMRQPPIIFRDLKPANVMLTIHGHIYLIDFGIARHFKPGQAKDTTALGSTGYAAPEQYGKAQTTPSADIYALGVTLHQLLSGNDPADTPFQFASLQLSGHPTLSGLETLIVQMIE
ncbi:MAG TPA: serine/threonine-protein kinase, partial [Ktedonobacteraceae bacterium]|nr:serine/threonine-protein kinase [Ktedonobacteraceae bacterium]